MFVDTKKRTTRERDRDLEEELHNLGRTYQHFLPPLSSSPLFTPVMSKPSTLLYGGDPFVKRQSRLTIPMAWSKSGPFFKRAPRATYGRKKKSLAAYKDVMAGFKDHQKKSKGISSAGIRFAECQLNPFGNGTTGAKSLFGKIPDADQSNTTTFTCTGVYDYTCSAPAGFIYMNAPIRANQVIAYHFLGGDPTAPLSEPVANVPVTMREDSLMAGIKTNDFRYRVVGGGIKIRAISPPDSTSGVMRGGHMDTSLFLVQSTPTYTSYGKAIRNLHEEFHTVQNGITIRHNYQERCSRFNPLPTYDDNQASGRKDIGEMPYVQFSGCSTTTVLHCDFVIHLEAIATYSEFPFPVNMSPYEPNIQFLIAFIISSETVVGGNSFKSFIGRLKKIAQTGYGFYKTHQAAIDPAIKLLTSFI